MPELVCGDSMHMPFENDKFGLILFSPPYWDVISDKSRWGGKLERESNPYSPTNLRAVSYGGPDRGGSDNIGNIHDYHEYLKEMKKVYSECFRTLKPGRFCVLIVKDLIRNKLTVPLSMDTLNVCQEVGFKVFDILVNKMYFPASGGYTTQRRNRKTGGCRR